MMQRFLKKYKLFCAIAVLVGTIVGAGTFGLPFVFSQSGFAIGLFYLIALTGVALLIHLAYGEIVLRTEGTHRLVGYAEKYLGQKAKTLTTGVVLFEYYGSLLAYIILGGEFLNILLGRFFGGGNNFWSIIFFLIATLVVGLGVKFVSGSELFMTFGLMAVVAILLFKGESLINYEYFSGVDWHYAFLPYGVVLFSLAGSVAVPEMRQVLIGQERRLKGAIIWGTLIPAIMYLVFIWVVLGITGPATSEDSILGLVPYLGDWVIKVGAIFGFLAVFTSFLVLGVSLKNIYIKDYGLPKYFALFLACAIPLGFYFIGIKSFILVVGVVGAVASGLDGFITVMIFLRAKIKGNRRPEYSLGGARILANLLIFIFSLGLVASLWSFFN